MLDSRLAVALQFVEAQSVSEALEAQLFLKSNKLYPTCRLIHTIWSKAKQLQQVSGFTFYSRIWNNNTYLELVK